MQEKLNACTYETCEDEYCHNGITRDESPKARPYRAYNFDAVRYDTRNCCERCHFITPFYMLNFEARYLNYGLKIFISEDFTLNV